MDKEIRIKDKDGNEIVIKHPIVIIRKAIKINSCNLALRGYKKKHPDYVFGQTAWYNIEECDNGDLVLIRALDGKKIKITIEVLE